MQSSSGGGGIGAGVAAASPDRARRMVSLFAIWEILLVAVFFFPSQVEITFLISL